MRTKALLLSLMLLVASCGDSGNPGGQDNGRTNSPTSMQLKQLKEKIKTSYDELKSSCECEGDTRYLLLGAITQAEFEKAKLNVNDIFSTINSAQSFYDQLTTEVIR